MKKIVILMACAGLLAACHRSENRGGAGTESGTYQGTTGSEGWSGSVTNTNTVITPQGPTVPSSEPDKTGAGGIGGRPETGPSGASDQNKDIQPGSDEDSHDATGPSTGQDTGPGGGSSGTGTGENGAGYGGY
jgi:hypothetical protein